MQRLKQRENPVSPMEAEAVLLLRAAEPYRMSPAVKQRVRIKLLAAPIAPQRLQFGRKLGVGVIVAAAAASAAWGTRAYLEHQHSRAVVITPNVAIAESRRELVPHRTAADALAPAATDLNPAPAEAAPAVHVPHRPNLLADKSLVYDAMRALRREGAPARAAQLLDEYLARFPGGAMGEEALALAIEAHQALQDGKAPAYANRYLAKYPDGRFTASALRVRTPATE